MGLNSFTFFFFSPQINNFCDKNIQNPFIHTQHFVMFASLFLSVHFGVFSPYDSLSLTESSLFDQTDVWDINVTLYHLLPLGPFLSHPLFGTCRTFFFFFLRVIIHAGFWKVRKLSKCERGLVRTSPLRLGPDRLGSTSVCYNKSRCARSRRLSATARALEL